MVVVVGACSVLGLGGGMLEAAQELASWSDPPAHLLHASLVNNDALKQHVQQQDLFIVCACAVVPFVADGGSSEDDRLVDLSLVYKSSVGFCVVVHSAWVDCSSEVPLALIVVCCAVVSGMVCSS